MKKHKNNKKLNVWFYWHIACIMLPFKLSFWLNGMLCSISLYNPLHSVYLYVCSSIFYCSCLFNQLFLLFCKQKSCLSRGQLNEWGGGLGEGVFILFLLWTKQPNWVSPSFLCSLIHHQKAFNMYSKTEFYLVFVILTTNNVINYNVMTINNDKDDVHH